MDEELVDRELYPELNLLLWDERARFISKKRAFYIYETRFHFIERKHLTNKEKEFINSLANEFGNGFLLTK
jgi:hypothetical protein